MRKYGTDANGTTPEVGDFVAYNCSGSIATGWITSTGKYKNRYRKIFHILQHAPTDGHKSVVRGGANCLLVLEKGDGVVKGFFTPEISESV